MIVISFWALHGASIALRVRARVCVHARAWIYEIIPIVYYYYRRHCDIPRDKYQSKVVNPFYCIFFQSYSVYAYAILVFWRNTSYDLKPVTQQF